MGISSFRGANIKLHQVVTKRLENTKESASIGKIPAGWLKELFNGREVNSYKTLEHINDMFKKKNNPKTPK